MELFDAIFNRRSIRDFKADKVSDELIHRMLEAAMAAPSASNRQNWCFVVIDDQKLLKQIPAIHPYAAMAARAPLGILVCGDTSVEKVPGFWVQNCSAAMQNLLLAAHALGLGGVWVGVYPVEDRIQAFTKLFKLPDKVIPLGLAVLGYPDQTPESVNRFDRAKIRRNQWTD